MLVYTLAAYSHITFLIIVSLIEILRRAAVALQNRWNIHRCCVCIHSGALSSFKTVEYLWVQPFLNLNRITSQGRGHVGSPVPYLPFSWVCQSKSAHRKTESEIERRKRRISNNITQHMLRCGMLCSLSPFLSLPLAS